MANQSPTYRSSLPLPPPLLQPRSDPFPGELSEEKSDYPTNNHVREIVDVEINSGPTNRHAEKDETPIPSSKRESKDSEKGQGRTGVPGRKGMIFVLIE